VVNNENLEKKKVKEKGLNQIILIVGILSVLFFIASAYGVQRTILSTLTEDKLEFSKWFTNWAWISIAFTIAGFGLFKAIAGLFTGVYTQRIGTKIMILLGAGCFVVGAIPLLLSNGDPLLLGIGNSILGAGEGMLYAGAMTYLSDISTAAHRAKWMGVMELAVYGGYSFGAVMAGWLRPTVILTCLNGHISKMVDGIIVLFLPLILSSITYGYGFSIRATGLITGVFTLSWAVIMPLAGNISDKIGRRLPAFLGLVIEAVAIFGLQAGVSPFPVQFQLILLLKTRNQKLSVFIAQSKI